MMTRKEHTILSETGRKFSFDISYQKNNIKKPLVIFVHGFKGFKDWGQFPLVADFFSKNGIAFLKMNFSFNGTTPESPIDFVDLEAFGENNFSKEIIDITSLINVLHSKNSLLDLNEIDLTNITLMGHSKGGATSIITGNENIYIQKIVTWGAVLDIHKRYASSELEAWKNAGVIYIYNGRTDQQMPLYYQLAEDALNQAERFNISTLLKKSRKPTLLIHGNEDETVLPNELTIAKQAQNKNIIIHEINGSHTFDGIHPYTNNSLPPSTMEACELTLKFIINE